MYRCSCECERLSRVHRDSDIVLIIILETYFFVWQFESLDSMQKKKALLLIVLWCTLTEIMLDDQCSTLKVWKKLFCFIDARGAATCSA